MMNQLNDDLLPGNSADRAALARRGWGGCRNRLASRLLPVAIATAIFAPSVLAAPTEILFVGNSYTFGRVNPVMSYNNANVNDLTRPRPDLPDPNFTDTTGTRAWEPHPWGGVAGIFKQFTVQAGLDYSVSMSARNAASLRGHFLNTANADWNLRGNVASKKWDVVMLQEQSDAALPAGKGANANLPQFSAYADKFEKFIHVGAAETYTERSMYLAIYGTTAACGAALGTPGTCSNTTARVIPANPNASAATKVYLTQTWARPDMVFSHLNTTPDTTSSDGRPIVDTSVNPLGTPDTLYYPTLAAMTADLHTSFASKVAANLGFAGFAAVGDAFQSAVDQGLVKTGGFYNAAGVYIPNGPGDPMNLWWDDYLHASKYGSYLSALVQFGKITGLDPQSLGFNELAAHDLGISGNDAYTLQQVAAGTLGFAVLPSPVPEPATVVLLLAGLGMLGFVARRRAA
jgi:hypothetical protein